MKTDIHPKYVETTVHCSCGNEFQTRSTRESLTAELCNECHPFYTGRQKLVDSGGRVEQGPFDELWCAQKDERWSNKKGALSKRSRKRLWR